MYETFTFQRIFRYLRWDQNEDFNRKTALLVRKKYIFPRNANKIADNAIRSITIKHVMQLCILHTFGRISLSAYYRHSCNLSLVCLIEHCMKILISNLKVNYLIDFWTNILKYYFHIFHEHRLQFPLKKPGIYLVWKWLRAISKEKIKWKKTFGHTDACFFLITSQLSKLTQKISGKILWKSASTKWCDTQRLTATKWTIITQLDEMCLFMLSIWWINFCYNTIETPSNSVIDGRNWLRPRMRFNKV